MSTPRGVAESYWAAECRRDIYAVMDHYHPDATYQDGAGLLHGSAAIRHYYELSIRDYPALEVSILREYVGGPDLSAFEESVPPIGPGSPSSGTDLAVSAARRRHAQRLACRDDRRTLASQNAQSQVPPSQWRTTPRNDSILVGPDRFPSCRRVENP